MRYLALTFLIISCSSNTQLKHSKELVTKGHKSLYYNGAFTLPHSTVKLIPSGPQAIKSSVSLLKNAKSSYVLSMQKSGEAFLILKKGTVASFKASKEGAEHWGRITDYINKHSRENSVWLMEKSVAAALGIIKLGNEVADYASRGLMEGAEDANRASVVGANNFARETDGEIRDFNRGMDGNSKAIKKTLAPEKTLGRGAKSFIRGYIELPENIGESYEDLKKSRPGESFAKDSKAAEAFREKWTGYSWGLISNSVLNYSKDIQASLSNAKKELQQTDDYGLTFSLFKSVGWLIDAGIWQAIVKPAGKMTGGALGYVATNGVVYPVMVMGSGAVAGVDVLVEYTQFAGESAYYVIAPTGKLALATILASGEAVLEGSALAANSASQVLGSAALHGKKVIGVGAIRASGPVGKSVTNYVLVPSVWTGVNLTAVTTGVVVGTGGTATAGAYAVTGEALGFTQRPIQGATIATGTAIGGAVSAAYGTTVMLYHGASSVVVPAGQTLGTGLVLTYGMLSQLSAHTILAMGDVSYLVISLEGPKWVLYGIKGNVDKNEYPEGTLIDLQKLKNDGEVIRKIPLSDDEVSKILN